MKARFLTELPVKDRPASRAGHFSLVAPVGFYSVKSGQEHTAQIGFETNYVTGRKLLVVRRIVQPKMDPAAVIHDLLYETGAVSRALADAVFLEAMLVLGVAAWRAYAAYAAVRICGWKFYRATLAPAAEQHPAGELEQETLLE
jgi:hypothetical protein